jgi:hypothetical protein
MLCRANKRRTAAEATSKLEAQLAALQEQVAMLSAALGEAPVAAAGADAGQQQQDVGRSSNTATASMPDGLTAAR